MISASSSGPGHGAGGGLDDRLDLLAHLGLGDAEDGDVGHGGVQHQDVLDLLGVDVDAARHDHEQLAVGQIEVALVVEVADVPQRGPALVVEGLARLLGVVVVLEGGGAGAAAEVDDAVLAGGSSSPSSPQTCTSPQMARPTEPGWVSASAEVIQVMPMPSVPE